MRYLAPTALSLIAPAVAQAQGFSDLDDFVTTVMGDIITPLIAVLSGIALLVFFWGLVKFIYQADSEDGRSAGRQRMIWGVIALFVLLSIQGIITFFQLSIFGTNSF